MLNRFIRGNNIGSSSSPQENCESESGSESSPEFSSLSPGSFKMFVSDSSSPDADSKRTQTRKKGHDQSLVELLWTLIISKAITIKSNLKEQSLRSLKNPFFPIKKPQRLKPFFPYKPLNPNPNPNLVIV